MRSYILTAAALLATGVVAGPIITAEHVPRDEATATTTTSTVSAGSTPIQDVCVLIPGDDEHEPLIIDSKVCACKCYIYTCDTYTDNDADYRFCLEKRDWWKAQQSELPYWWSALGTMGACTGSHACSKAPDNDWTIHS
ncbi:hypothetical protein QBC43DRAFT_284835 [Cladorrhinum sp. PSN259]|nr:hypothetical protein QBC43DRAFT_284835 [Cladorrhinum sp. PSN259]